MPPVIRFPKEEEEEAKPHPLTCGFAAGKKAAKPEKMENGRNMLSALDLDK